MTVQQILDKINWLVFGDSTPPSSVSTHLIGSEGLISQAHRRIQEEWDYWFMEENTTISVVSGISNYTMPTDIKREISLYFTNATTGYYESPLQKLMKGQMETTFTNPSATATYPTHYEIFGGSVSGTYDTLYIYPEPSAASTLNLRYYKYFTRPTAGGSTDQVTVYAHYPIIYTVALELCMALDYQQKMMILNEKYKEALASLRTYDFQKKTGGENGGLYKTEYVGY